MTSSEPTPGAFPMFVHVGFSGSRHLFDRAAHPGVDAAAFEAALAGRLAHEIAGLRGELGLGPQHALCGISQIATGGDFVFTTACSLAKVPQCIYLPQSLDEYVAAIGSEGRPDFSLAEAAQARALMASQHIIAERVIAAGGSRAERFDEVKLEILDDADLVICLIGVDGGKPGGTSSMRVQAERRGKPVLLLQVAVQADGDPGIDKREWSGMDKGFALPEEPEALAPDEPEATAQGTAAPVSAIDALGARASHLSQAQRSRFTVAAAMIILTHLGATMLAVMALVLHGVHWPWLMPILLVAELTLLGIGLRTHLRLHHAEFAPRWAIARLVAEIARSASAARALPIELTHFKRLPFPESLRGLLRSVNTQHLRESRAARGLGVKVAATAYIDSRLEGKKGQLGYYERASASADRDQQRARVVFYVATSLAITATLFKMLINLPDLLLDPMHMPLPQAWAMHAPMTSFSGVLAIVLPLVAVAALSLAGAHDFDARAHTYREMLAFLKAQRTRLVNVSTHPELARLVLETEFRLLGETTTWYSRRRFAAVA